MFSKIKGPAFLSASDSISKFIVFILLPFIASYFDTNSLNSYLFNLLFFQLLSVLFLNSLNNLIVIDVVNCNESVYKKNFHSYLNTMLFLFVIGSCIYSLVSHLFFEDLFLGLVISISALSNALVIFILAYARAKRIFSPIANLLLQKFFLILVINLILIPQFPYEHLIFLITGFVNAYVILRSLKIFKIEHSLSKFNLGSISYPLKYGFSLIPHTLSNWIRGSADKFFVYGLFSGTALSAYLIAYQYTSYVIVFFTILSQMIQPFIFKSLKDQNSNFSKHFITYGLFALIITIGAYFVVSLIINFFFIESYRIALDFFSLMIIGAFFQALYFYLSHFFVYFKENLFLSKTSMYVSLILVVCGFLVAEYVPTLKAFSILFVVAPVSLFFICSYNFIKMTSTKK